MILTDNQDFLLHAEVISLQLVLPSESFLQRPSLRMTSPHPFLCQADRLRAQEQRIVMLVKMWHTESGLVYSQLSQRLTTWH